MSTEVVVVGQIKGGVGKSTIVQGLMRSCATRALKIALAEIETERRLSDPAWYGDHVAFVPITVDEMKNYESGGELYAGRFDEILGLMEAGNLLLDCGAGVITALARALKPAIREAYGLGKGERITWVVPTDQDVTTLEETVTIVLPTLRKMTPASRIYVVRNNIRGSAWPSDNSEFMKRIRGVGAKTIDIPRCCSQHLAPVSRLRFDDLSRIQTEFFIQKLGLPKGIAARSSALIQAWATEVVKAVDPVADILAKGQDVRGRKVSSAN